jgi:Bax protein
MHSKTVAATTLLAALAMAALPIWQSWRAQPPDFKAYPAGEARKSAFFSYLGPLIDAANARWRERRSRLAALKAASQADSGWRPGKRDKLWLDAQVAFFEVAEDQPLARQIDDLLEHVDAVPRSLALAQAAKESAWGTSRFAADANNYFGQRCHDKGCGVVPENRAPGARFEVRRFESPEASVRSYMYNINSHPEYAAFRAYRAAQRAAGKPVSGIQAAEQLTQYSERRQAYVDEIRSLIHFNELEQLEETLRNQTEETEPETTTL